VNRCQDQCDSSKKNGDGVEEQGLHFGLGWLKDGVRLARARDVGIIGNEWHNLRSSECIEDERRRATSWALEYLYTPIGYTHIMCMNVPYQPHH
jgi:hypothetical protein